MHLHRLSALSVKAKLHDGRPGALRLHDGGGLYLQITPGGTKSWLFRYTLEGKPHWYGLGAYGLATDGAVSLAAARALAGLARVDVEAGRDLVETRRHHKRTAMARKATAADRTFKAAAERLMDKKSGDWKNAKHRAQWTATLATYAYPTLGDMDVSKIETTHVMAVLEAIWTKLPETARRVRGRIEAVLDSAKVEGLRTGDNPALWRGHLSMAFGGKRVVENQPALPYFMMPGFIEAVGQREGAAARALEFLILTAARTGEVIGATCGEINLDAALWTVPGARMKASREHRVPLSGPALALLRVQLPLARGPDSPVFQGPGATALSNMAMLSLLKRMNRGARGVIWADGATGAAITAHGFRSSLRDWVGAGTEFPSDVAEAALAHRNKDKVEAAYLRGDMLAKRVVLMEKWAEFCFLDPLA